MDFCSTHALILLKNPGTLKEDENLTLLWRRGNGNT